MRLACHTRITGLASMRPVEFGSRGRTQMDLGEVLKPFKHYLRQHTLVFTLLNMYTVTPQTWPFQWCAHHWGWAGTGGRYKGGGRGGCTGRGGRGECTRGRYGGGVQGVGTGAGHGGVWRFTHKAVHTQGRAHTWRCTHQAVCSHRRSLVI